MFTGYAGCLCRYWLERNAFLYVDDAQLNNEKQIKVKAKTIEQLLGAGEEIMVQVIKIFGSKGARLTKRLPFLGVTWCSCPGNYTGVSRRIEDAAEREGCASWLQLRPEDMGLIVRTVAEGEDALPFSRI